MTHSIVKTGIKNKKTGKVHNILKKNGDYTKYFIKKVNELKSVDLNKLIKTHGLTHDKILSIKDNKHYYDKDENKFYEQKYYLKNNNLSNKKILNNIVFNQKRGDDYMIKINKKISSLNKDVINNFTIDLTRYNLKKFINKIKEDYNNKKKHVLFSFDKVRFYTLSNKTINNLNEKYNEYKVYLTGSDYAIIRDSRLSDKLYVKTIKSSENVKKLNYGGFFKYINKTNFDFSRYGIYKEIKKENYYNNCLYLALKNGGLCENKLKQLQLIMASRDITLSKLELICNQLDISIILRYYKGKKNKVIKKIFNKNNKKEVYEIGLYENHYFIYETCENTSYSLRYYDDIKDINNCNKIEKKTKERYQKSNKKFIDSMKLIKLLIENKNLLEPIKLCDEIFDTQYYDKIVNDDDEMNLEYNDSNVRLVEYKEKKNSNYYIIYFDFESYVGENNIHTPYLCCYETEDGIKQKFYGINCAFNMLESLPINKKILLIAHNLSFDYSFIINLIKNQQTIIKGGKLLTCKGYYYNSNNNKIELTLKDSYSMITMPLRNFKKSFKLEMEKEVMNYEIYNKSNIEKRYIEINEILEDKDDEFKKQYLKNSEKWNCIFEDKIDIIKYSRKYCELDCTVLKQGYKTFRKWILDIYDMDIVEEITISGLAENVFKKEGVYEGVYELSSIPMNFIQKCIVGGRTMTNNNKIYHVKKQLNDFDAVALYPSSMNRLYENLGGFLKGTPKIIKNLDYNWLKEKTDGYFVYIKILDIGIKRDFALTSYVNENKVRIFSNDMINKKIHVDKISLEDLIKYQDIKFEIICGYYFNEGRNEKIGEVINNMFNSRLKYKKDNNPIQLIFKLLMNSSYGKTLLRPIDTDTKIIQKKDFNKYLSRNYNFIKEYTVSGDNYIVKTYKPIINHFNLCHIGCEILSMSKRIMNEVMCTAEDNDLKIYYQDTDSIHIEDKNIELLRKCFKEKYNRELIGKKMGQFHSDFEFEGCSNVVSIESYFLGKKMYIDRLRGINSDNEYEYTDHIRMKGIPTSCVKYECNKRQMTPLELYDKLYNGGVINFDLTENMNACMMKRTKELKFEQLNTFNRRITINDEMRNIK